MNQPVHFGQRLITNTHPDPRLYFLHPERTNKTYHGPPNLFSQQWVYAGDLPISSHTVFMTILPTEEMLAIAVDTGRHVYRVFKGSLRSEV